MATTNKLHFLLIPHIGPGHTIPMIDMAKLLAKQPNVMVTIATTPLNATRYGPTLVGPIKAGLAIQFLEIPFPAVEAGLPEGCESTDQIPSLDYVPNFLAAIGMLQQKLEERYGTLKPCPNCIISDKYMSWTGEFADKYKIPRIMFDGMSCFNELCYNNLYVTKIFDGLDESEPFVVPGVVINSFEELEQEYVNEYKKLRGGKVWCIGPLSLISSDDSDNSQRGNAASIDEEKCKKWLDAQEPESVVYACFGSLVRVNTPQLIELGLGLEASNHPFIWVIRSVHREMEVEEWLAESGFEERHCGWNSTLESVCAGVPMITWPQFAEQFINEKLVLQVLGMGVGVGVDSVVHVGEEDMSGVKVKREGVKKAIEKAMDDGIEGQERRKRAKELGKIANNAIKEGGSSYLNLTMLIQDIMHYANAAS